MYLKKRTVISFLQKITEREFGSRKLVEWVKFTNKFDESPNFYKFEKERGIFKKSTNYLQLNKLQYFTFLLIF